MAKQLSAFSFSDGDTITLGEKTATRNYRSRGLSDPELAEDVATKFYWYAEKNGNDAAERLLGISEDTARHWKGNNDASITPQRWIEMSDCQAIYPHELTRKEENHRALSALSWFLENKLDWLPDLGKRSQFLREMSHSDATPLKPLREYLEERFEITTVSYGLLFVNWRNGGPDYDMLSRAGEANENMYKATYDHEFTEARRYHFIFHYVTTHPSLREDIHPILKCTCETLSGDGWASNQRLLDQADETYDRHSRQLQLFSELTDGVTLERLIKFTEDRFREVAANYC